MFSWFSSTPPSQVKSNDSESDVVLNVNGETHKVPTDLAANILLCDYLRDHLHLTGTKYMCREGTCGSCVVGVTRFNPVLKEEKTFSINSCLLPVYACSGFNIWTIEGIGKTDLGSKIQAELVNKNGTQCGFCTSGMVMTMYSFLENKTTADIQDVEDLFDGNMCRCTGYRPILDTAKSVSQMEQIKNLCNSTKEKKCVNGTVNGQWEVVSRRPPPIKKSIRIQLEDADWYRPMTLDELYDILRNMGEDEKYRLVCGNTSMGIFTEDGPYDVYIDTKGIQEFYQCDLSENGSTLGANICLSDFITILEKMEKGLTGFSYCGDIARHVKLVATTHVRNIGCWAGNIMTKKNHPDFPSDIFTMLEAARATINLGHFDGSQKSLSPLKLLSFDTSGWVILNLQMQPLSSDSFFRSYKIMPRSQSSQAYVNCAFLIEVNKDDNFTVLSTPSIVYAGISSKFIHAKKTENFLKGKQLSDPQVLEESLDKLYKEITPDPERFVGGPKYRKQLAINLIYKFFLEVLPDVVSPELVSGGAPLIRPISSGTQIFDTDRSTWPLNKPISKLEAKAQCSGKAEYIMDIPRPGHTLYAAFVISTVGNAYVDDMDASEALSMPGVVKFITYKDIPGANNIFPMRMFFSSEPEELLSSGRVPYAGQPLALIVAESQAIASEAAKRVKVTYKDQEPLVLTLDEAVKNLPPPLPDDEMFTVNIGDAEGAMKTAPNVIQGEARTGSQYNVHMETQVTLCIPTEDGMDVYTSTQWADLSQQAIAETLGVKKNSINIQVRRLGGAYGGKISRNLFTATGCALAASIIDRPMFLQMDLQTNFELVGQRTPVLAKYQAGFDNDGKLQAVKIEYYVDFGCAANEIIVRQITSIAQNGYACPNWLLVPRSVRTTTASNTYVRSPGSTEGVFVTEVMMENIAKYLQMNAWDVKALNLRPPSKDGSNLQDMLKQLLTDANVDERAKNIEEFNKNNRWKKKGLSIVPTEFPVAYLGLKYTAIVSIFRDGGSVAVTHGGIEMGQGINTKVAQVVAYELGIPLDYVSVKPTRTLTAPNSDPSGASIASESNCKAAMECCAILLERMKPIRDKLQNPTWEQLVDACYNEGVDLCAEHMTGPLDQLKDYSAFGCACAEVEIDVLTGQHEILRVDILYDCGKSISPEIDVGQIEGAFVMGVGLFLLEEIKLDASTGRKLTNRLWTYFPPASKDIPADFRITLLKKASNPFGVLGSKATGEPPLGVSCSALFAIQAAIHSVRADHGYTRWVPLNAPATAESILLATKIKKESLVYKLTDK